MGAKLAAMLLGIFLLWPAATAVAAAPDDRNGADADAGRSPVMVEPDPVTGTARSIQRRGGLLTGPSSRSPRRIALGFFRDNATLVGLDPGGLGQLELRRSYTAVDGVRHLVWVQELDGVPVLDRDLRANVTREGRLVNVTGGPVPDPAPTPVEPRLSRVQALRIAARAAGLRGKDASRASLTLVPAGGSSLSLAWRALIFDDSGDAWDTVVDARTGQVLRRNGLVRRVDGSGLAFDLFPGAPVGGSQVTKTFPGGGGDPWLTGAFNELRGNNVWAYSDVEDDVYTGPLAGEPFPSPGAADSVPPSAGAAWSYPVAVNTAASPHSCPSTGCTWDDYLASSAFSWDMNREQAATQAFYLANNFHDHLRDAPGIAFDEASGNMEAIHTGGAPGAGDELHVQVMDGANTDLLFPGFPDAAHTNNADMLPLPDGQSPRMQLYLFSDYPNDPAVINDVNGTDDADIVYHEYTHAMTNRLVTDAAGFGALNQPQAFAMDEAWADWYATDYLVGQGFRTDTAAPGELAVGEYEDVAFRSEPVDCPVGSGPSACPGTPGAGSGGYTYGDFGEIDGVPEPHADGEIWSQTLWDLRRALIAKHGVGTGLSRTRALVTGAMRISPTEPDFLDMRDAILAQDQALGFGETTLIWSVFAARGMGVNASTTGASDTDPVQDFAVPGPSPPSSPPSSPPAPGTTSPSPDTKITGGLRSIVKKRHPKVRFSSSERGATFQCRLIRRGKPRPPFGPCTSPHRLKVKNGRRYDFQVTAIDAAGNVDPEPASKRFKVRLR
jgi:extracellular elastinolytic metalloproteinase